MPGPLPPSLALALALLSSGTSGSNPGQAEAEAAVEAGRLRLSGSVSHGRLRVALVDEDERVGRVQAFAVTARGRHSLPRLDTNAADRIEFAVEPAHGLDVTIRVEAYLRNTDPPILAHAIELEAPPPLPSAPVPAAPAPAPATRVGPSIPWWLIAGAVVATALAGAAVYQEID